MNAKNVFLFTCLLSATTSAPILLAEDVDLTNLIVNHDFEYVSENTPMTADSWKPKENSTTFYGWICDLDVLGGTSQGINKDFANHHGTYGCWIASTTQLPDFWEFYQVIGKDQLEAGTYKVQCLLSGTKRPTSQRLFLTIYSVYSVV